MSPSQIKQQIATLLETEPSKITVKLTNKSDDREYDPIIALHVLLPIIEEHDPHLAKTLNEIVFEDLRNSEQNGFTINIFEENKPQDLIQIHSLPSIFRSGRKPVISEEISESSI